MQLALLLNASKTNHQLLCNSLDKNKKTIILNILYSKSEKSNNTKIRKEITSIIQVQLEIKDYKIQHVKNLFREKFEIYIKINS